MKTLKLIINALLILLMAIYGLAMLALLILLAGRRATICLLSCLDLAPS